MKNLFLAFPKLTESHRRQLAQKSFQQVGRTAVEMLWSTALNDQTLEKIAVFEGREHLDAAIAEGRGALITTAHFGNWELMGVALAHIGVPMNVIVRTIDDPQVESVLNRLRTRTGARVIHKDNGVRPALRALRAGEVVGVLVDQNTLPSQASFVPFFGEMAATTRVSAQLHVRSGAPVIMLFCVPEGERYRFVIEPLDTTGVSIQGTDKVEQLTAAMTTQIERHIRLCPEAWLWIHDRWRSRPPSTDEKTAR
jgi:KDO2-lipid IV(A) lauroyltransferase|tara:strand:- start:899 stop:1657 length:759 start_codon:yes stop_codon:yes gene_type:complete